MPEEAWKQALSELREHANARSSEILGASMESAHLDASGIVFSAPNRALLEQIKNAYGPAIQSRMASILGRPVPVRFVLSKTGSKDKEQQYKLDDFIAGEANLLAYRAVCSVAKQGRPSPLTLQGPAGCGKTHLMQGLAHSLQSKGRSVLCLGSVDLRDRFLAALHQHRVPELKQEWRDYRSLLVDDLQLLSSAPATLEEVSHLVAHYLDAGRPVIVTSDRPVESYIKDPRLQSRLGSGLAVRIDPPDLELRIHMIRQISDKAGIALRRDEIEQLAAPVGNYRSLAAVVSQLALQGQPAPVPTQMDQVVDAVCRAFRIQPEDLLGNSRKTEHAGPRHAAMVLALRHTQLTKSSIARFFRKKDHTTVIHAEKKIAAKLRQNSAFRHAFTEATKALTVSNLSDSSDGVDGENLPLEAH